MESLKNEQAHAQRALALVEALFAQLREMSYEGIHQITLQTRTQALTLYPSKDVVNTLVFELTEDTIKQHDAVKRVIEDYWQDIADSAADRKREQEELKQWREQRAAKKAMDLLDQQGKNQNPAQ
jgi:hypothetical protein